MPRLYKLYFNPMTRHLGSRSRFEADSEATLYLLHLSATSSLCRTRTAPRAARRVLRRGLHFEERRTAPVCFVTKNHEWWLTAECERKMKVKMSVHKQVQRSETRTSIGLGEISQQAVLQFRPVLRLVISV